MKVAIDISSTKSGHKFRGIGFYTQNLVDKIDEVNDSSFEIVKFSKQIPQADLYHFPAFSPFFFSFPFNLINKTILTIHDLIPIQYKNHYPAGIKGNIRWQIQKYFLKKARHIITDSIYSQKIIIQLTNIIKEKVSVVYLAADPVFKQITDNDLINQIKEKFNLPAKFILYVGDMNWNKNVNMLARTCVDLNIPLIVAGKQAVEENIDRKHPENQELVKFQDFTKSNPQYIKCLGFVESNDLINLYNLATIYVCPSIVEGFGLPVLEAMQCGCPVICSQTSSLPEVAGQAAQYFNPISDEELKNKIQQVWQNQKLRERMSQAGLIQAKKFSWKKTAEQTLNIYKKIYEN